MVTAAHPLPGSKFRVRKGGRCGEKKHRAGNHSHLCFLFILRTSKNVKVLFHMQRVESFYIRVKRFLKRVHLNITWASAIEGFFFLAVTVFLATRWYQHLFLAHTGKEEGISLFDTSRINLKKSWSNRHFLIDPEVLWQWWQSYFVTEYWLVKEVCGCSSRWISKRGWIPKFKNLAPFQLKVLFVQLFVRIDRLC